MTGGIEVGMPLRPRYSRAKLQRLGQGPWLTPPSPAPWLLPVLAVGAGVMALCHAVPVLPFVLGGGLLLTLIVWLGATLSRQEIQVCPQCLEACSRGAYVCPRCHFREGR